MDQHTQNCKSRRKIWKRINIIIGVWNEKRCKYNTTPKEETKCRIFVNRDVNACKNILLLGKCYLESQTRPEPFTRKVIKSENIKKPKNK